MAKNIKKQTLCEIVSKFLTTEEKLKANLCYVREQGETNTTTYLATSNPEIAIEVVGGIEESEAIDLGLDLGWALNEYDACVAESDGILTPLIRIPHNSHPLYVDTTELNLKAKGVQVAPASEIVEKHSVLTQKLKAGNVLIIYQEAGNYKILHTSLSNKTLFAWVYDGSGREVYQVQNYFEQGSDIGVISLPDIDAPYPTYRHINLLDVLEVKIVG